MAKVGIVVLAAGEASRLGRPKQLLKYQGQTLLQRIALESTSVTPFVVVVLGARYDLLHSELDTTSVNVVNNTNWSTGMGSSIKAGVAALEKKYDRLDSIIITTCDQPYVDANYFQRLIKSFTKETQVVASGYEKTVGIPALFTIELVESLLKMPDNEGAKKIIEHSGNVKVIPFSKGAIDIDTEEDWRKFNNSNS